MKIGNILAARVALMILVCCARGARFLVEQPEGSSLPNHPRFQEIFAIVRDSCLKKWIETKRCDWFILYRHDLLLKYLRSIPPLFGWGHSRVKRRSGTDSGAMTSSSLRRWPKLAGLCPGPIWRSFLAMTIHWSKSIWISLGRSGMWVLPTGLKKASSLFANNLYVKVKEIN